MTRVLFLCTGNTCRSPLAELFARQHHKGAVVFESAGLQVRGRLPASEGSRAVALSHGLSLEFFTSQPVSRDLLEGTRWVIGMTRSHAAIFRSRFRGMYSGQIGVLGAPGADLLLAKSSPLCEEVDDPYGESEETYHAAGDQILRLVLQWAPVFSRTPI